MLVISRKVGEWVKVGAARVYVQRVQGHQVRIAIEAPEEVKILRGELAERAAGEAEQRTEVGDREAEEPTV